MFKEKLRFLRRMNDLTQAKMALMLNISTTGYASWEQGLAEPSLEDLRKICIIFKVSADELLEIDTSERRREININNGFIGNGNISNNSRVINNGANINNNFTNHINAEKINTYYNNSTHNGNVDF